MVLRGGAAESGAGHAGGADGEAGHGWRSAQVGGGVLLGLGLLTRFRRMGCVLIYFLLLNEEFECRDND